jgi:hypothetical protein
MSFAPSAASAATRALIESNAREAADLVGQLTLLLDRMGADPCNLAAARMVTRRLSDRLAQANVLEKLAGSGGWHPDAWSPIEVVEELEHEAVSLMGDRIDVRVIAPDLVPQFWFFDRELVTMALSCALHAALLHAVASVGFEFGMQGGYLGFSILDDAGAFPDELLDERSAILERGELNGNALGVHFARRVAALHVNQERRGRLELSNHARGEGTRFTLWLP